MSLHVVLGITMIAWGVLLVAWGSMMARRQIVDRRDRKAGLDRPASYSNPEGWGDELRSWTVTMDQAGNETWVERK